jgi:hypothetical protein
MASQLKKSTNTVTKPINSHGESYWELAAKQINWPVDLKERHISVPESELEAAQDNLMVQHFLHGGFHIQSCIEAPRTTVFDPTIRLRTKTRDRSEFEIDDMFEIVSDGAKLQIRSLEKNRITLAYFNRPKPDITTNIEQLRKVLNFKVWKRLN